MHRRDHFHHHHRGCRPNPHYRRRPPPPQFAVLLNRHSRDPSPLGPRSIDDLIASLPSPPKDPLVFPSREKRTAAKLLFSSLSDALDAAAFLWRRRLDGAHFLVPEVEAVSSAVKAEELRRVKGILIEHVESLLGGESVSRCQERADELEGGIRRKATLLSRPKRINVAREIKDEKERLEAELATIYGKLGEFKDAMEGILSYLKEGKDRVLGIGEFDLFKFGRDLDLRCLVRIHSIVARECRRLTDGLPIYSCRRELLQTMFFNQVTVVIGDTGSGKSTQLVQYFADYGKFYSWFELLV